MPALCRWYLFGGYSIIIVVHSTMFKVIALNGNELISRLGTFTERVSNHGCNDMAQWFNGEFISKSCWLLAQYCNVVLQPIAMSKFNPCCQTHK